MQSAFKFRERMARWCWSAAQGKRAFPEIQEKHGGLVMTFGALLGSLELGMIYAILALGVFLSFRTLNMPDLTVDGSIVTGMAVSAMVCAGGGNPFLALIGAFIGGGFAGLATGLLAYKTENSGNSCGNPRNDGSLFGEPENHGQNAEHPAYQKRNDIQNRRPHAWIRLYGGIIINVILLVLIITVLYMFLQTRLGFVFRATGDNEDMVKACGVSCDAMKLMGLAVSNGFVGLAGGMLAQNQGFADINSGVGMMVIGLSIGNPRRSNLRHENLA